MCVVLILELLKEPDVGGNAEAGSSNPVIKPKMPQMCVVVLPRDVAGRVSTPPPLISYIWLVII